MNTFLILLEKLYSLQQKNGSFLQETIPHSEPKQSIYYTALILITIHQLPDSKIKTSITNRGITYLKSNMGAQRTWNYISREHSSPYPDDLDDTFLCLTAIMLYDRSFITPEILVGITQLLIRNEHEIGGPYTTWITQDKNWLDIDIIVNAHIYRFLNLLTISLPSLDDYFNNKIEANDLVSQYYNQPLVTLYLLSQSLPEHLQGTIRNYVYKHLNTFKPVHSLEHLILATFLDVTTNTVINKSISHYLEKPLPLFIERLQQTTTVYSFSSAFQIALLLQLNLSKPSLLIKNTTSTSLANIIDTSRILLNQYIGEYSLIYKEISNQMRILAPSAETAQLLLPEIFLKHLKPELSRVVSQDIIERLNLACLLGWASFTIQDQVIDGETTYKKIPIITSCMLIMQEIIHSILIGSSDTLRVQKLFHTINEALLQETVFQTVTITNFIISLPVPLETSEPLETLSYKSLGIAMSSITLTLLLPIENSYQSIELLVHYYKKVLTLKQLLDDMHDWYDDLVSGFLNRVGQEILIIANAQCRTSIHIIKDKEYLYELFWKYIFDSMYNESQAIIRDALVTVNQLTLFSHTEFLTDPLYKYQNVFEKTLHEKNNTLKFLSAYKKTTSQ